MTTRTALRSALMVVILLLLVSVAWGAWWMMRDPATVSSSGYGWPSPPGKSCVPSAPCFAQWVENAPFDGSKADTTRAVIRSSDSLTFADGSRRPVVAADSVTVLVLLSAACDSCASTFVRLRELKGWATLQGLSLRVASPSPSDANVYRRLLPGDTATIAVASADLASRMGVSRFPSTVFIDHRGHVRLRMQGSVPLQSQILDYVNENTGWAGHGRWQ